MRLVHPDLLRNVGCLSRLLRLRHPVRQGNGLLLGDALMIVAAMTYRLLGPSNFELGGAHPNQSGHALIHNAVSWIAYLFRMR